MKFKAKYQQTSPHKTLGVEDLWVCPSVATRRRIPSTITSGISSPIAGNIVPIRREYSHLPLGLSSPIAGNIVTYRREYSHISPGISSTLTDLRPSPIFDRCNITRLPHNGISSSWITSSQNLKLYILVRVVTKVILIRWLRQSQLGAIILCRAIVNVAPSHHLGLRHRFF